MKKPELQFNVNRLFPFYILVDKQLQIISIGKSLEKICTAKSQHLFSDQFLIKRPETHINSFEDFNVLINQLVVVETKSDQPISLRGQFELIENPESFLFVGTPWLGSMDQVRKLKLTLHDFAIHDPMIDLLHVLKTQEITNDEIKQLLRKVNDQKNKLKTANEEIQNIALFPTQNPDPLIRINFNGDVLRMNPAAEKLMVFEYENNTYNSKELFKEIAILIDSSQERWFFEAKSNGNDYSFACINMKEYGYVNMYGRNITQQKKDQQELERLSLIIHQTVNAVIVTDSNGKVEWVNDAFTRITGYTLDEMKGITPGSKLQGPKTDPEVANYMRTQIKNAQPFICEIYNYKKSGEGYWLRINGQPIFDKYGKVVQFFAIEEDITKEKTAQMQLNAYANRMSTLITNLHAGILLENDQRKIALVNQQFCTLFNIPAEPEQLLDSDCSKSAEQSKHLFKDPITFVNKINKILKDKKLVTGDELELLDGKFYERDFVPLWNDEKYDGHLWIYRDITESKKAESQLKIQEEKYRSIVEKATDIIYKVNAEGYFTFVNDVAEHITGYSKEELLKMRYSQLIRNDFKKQAFEIYRNQIENKTPSTYFEFPLVTKYGKEIWMGQSVQYPKTKDASSQLTALAIDIDKRKHAELNLKLQEEKYRNIIANMNLGLLEVDIEDNIQHANQSFCKMSGYTLEELIGKKAAELFMGEEEKNLIKEKNESRKTGVSDVYSIPVKNKMGERRWWVVSGAPRYNDNGKLVGSVGIHLDITEQKHLEEELKIAKSKAEESSKAKESFLATMSHEIRTPLNAIIGITDLMQLDMKTRNNENIDILSFSSKTLLALITDILDLSKIDAGKIDLAANPVDLKIMLNGIYQMFRSSCEEKKVELILAIDKSVPEIIIGDELRLSQILNNLVSNAVKFTSKGYVKISISADNLGADKCRLNFKVIDTGIGIKKDKLKTIFEDFEQADTKIVRQFGGTGLGLSITKKLIELKGGQIKVESKLNMGSTFSFSLDFKTAKLKLKGNETDDASRQHAKLKMEDKTILIVEDNIVNQKVAVSYLNHWGLKYDIANNGKEALELLSKKHFDLALIDLFMPVMDGFETIKHIRKNKVLKGFPIIALTASAELNLMDKAIELGADKCITKPFNSQQLHDTIVSLIRFEELGKLENIKLATRKKAPADFKLIDLKNLNDASLGSQKFVAEMLTILSSEIPASIKSADDLLKTREWLSFSKEIHKIKNSVLMLGMEFLRNDLRFMEEHSKLNEKTDEIEAAFARLKNTWKKALPEIINAKKECRS